MEAELMKTIILPRQILRGRNQLLSVYWIIYNWFVPLFV